MILISGSLPLCVTPELLREFETANRRGSAHVAMRGVMDENVNVG